MRTVDLDVAMKTRFWGRKFKTEIREWVQLLTGVMRLINRDHRAMSDEEEVVHLRQGGLDCQSAPEFPSHKSFQTRLLRNHATGGSVSWFLILDISMAVEGKVRWC